MSTKRGVLSGSQVATTHTTFIGGIIPIIEAAKKSSAVERVVPGPIRRVGTNQPRIRFQEGSARLKTPNASGGGKQSLFLHTKDPGAAEAVVRAPWRGFLFPTRLIGPGTT